MTAWENLAAILNRVAYGKERLVLTRRGRSLAAIVPIEDLELLEELEDERDSTTIRERLAEWQATGEPAVDLEACIEEREGKGNASRR